MISMKGAQNIFQEIDCQKTESTNVPDQDGNGDPFFVYSYPANDLNIDFRMLNPDTFKP